MRRPKSPCQCPVDGYWRLIVAGPRPQASGFSAMLADIGGPNASSLETPAYDPMLKEWFLDEADALPDEDRDDLICVVCDEPTTGIVGYQDVGIYREEAGLSSEWHFRWI